MILKTLPIVLADAVGPVRDFYVDALGFETTFDSDWFVTVKAPGNEAAELAIWRRDHHLVPLAIRAEPAGVILNIIVDDVDARFAQAQSDGLPILLQLRDEPYGQRRFLTRDPAGTVVDVSTPIAMAADPSGGDSSAGPQS